MTSETILSCLDHLCNEARNAMHATFGLMEFRPNGAGDGAWLARFNASRSSAERLLATLDDVRELVSGEIPDCLETLEEIDLALCVGEISELLNLAARDCKPRLALDCDAESPRIRQQKLALEEVLTRILKLVLKRVCTGLVRVDVSSAGRNRARIGIAPPGSEVARQLAQWLNGDPEQLKFSGPDLDVLVPAVVTGRRLRALGGNAEFVCEPDAPACLAIYLPRQIKYVEEQASDPLAARRPLHVLVAEDSDESYALTQLLLGRESVERARNGLEAFDKVKQRRFDVVLMDVHMPGMDGYASIRMIRDWETHSGNARTPIVVLSSDDLGKQTRSAAQCGCSGYLRKPVRRSDLADLIEPLRALAN